jgi:HAMP domain-containing protein
MSVASDMAETFGADDLNVKTNQRLDEIGALRRSANGR